MIHCIGFQVTPVAEKTPQILQYAYVTLLQDDGQPRFSVADLQAQLEPLLNGLFGAFSKPESGENEYVMKCVMRLIVFVGPQVGPHLTLMSNLSSPPCAVAFSILVAYTDCPCRRQRTTY